MSKQRPTSELFIVEPQSFPCDESPQLRRNRACAFLNTKNEVWAIRVPSKRNEQTETHGLTGLI